MKQLHGNLQNTAFSHKNLEFKNDKLKFYKIHFILSNQLKWINVSQSEQHSDSPTHSGKHSLWWHNMST